MAEQKEQTEAAAPEEDASADEASAAAEENGADEAATAESAADESATEEDADAQNITEEEEVSPEEASAARLAERSAGPEALDEEDGRKTRKERVGVVVSAKMDKTIVVSIERSKKHPMYEKYLTRSARKMTHDENEDAGEGDTVRIMETRPISKNKRWRLVEVIERAA